MALPVASAPALTGDTGPAPDAPDTALPPELLLEIIQVVQKNTESVSLIHNALAKNTRYNSWRIAHLLHARFAGFSERPRSPFTSLQSPRQTCGVSGGSFRDGQIPCRAQTDREHLGPS